VLSILRRLGPRLLILASVGLVATIAFWYFTIRTPRIPQRTLRISVAGDRSQEVRFVATQCSQ
jgi:hypothetical protein